MVSINELQCKNCTWRKDPLYCAAKDVAIDEQQALDCTDYDAIRVHDEVNKSGKWEFDEEVSAVFTNMLERSIPNYQIMRSLCFRIGSHFIKDGGTIADIGCSNGLSSELFIKNFPANKFILSDVSVPMLDKCKEKYSEQIDTGNVHIQYSDLRNEVLFRDADLCISCLTIQFVPIEYRQTILCNIFDNLRQGGALILVEKLLGNSAELDNIFVDEYYNLKRENGYTESLIQSKRKSLEGVLVPLTTNFNEQLLHNAGFRKVDCFWRCLNFAAWVAVK